MNGEPYKPKLEVELVLESQIKVMDTLLFDHFDLGMPVALKNRLYYLRDELSKLLENLDAYYL